MAKAYETDGMFDQAAGCWEAVLNAEDCGESAGEEEKAARRFAQTLAREYGERESDVLKAVKREGMARYCENF